ncbi:MAG: PQQ-binding-like beta-propeller repeat protein [Pirellulaceae bacterium]|nr:PQQ-binding-like beta-propeller repeat protein [Pirellulaceae bacterium]
MMKSFVSLVLVMFVFSSIAMADNWGHWRGATGNGVAVNAQPPTEWSSSKNIKWKVEVPGRGSSSPIIWNDRVFVTTAVPTVASSAIPGKASRGGSPRVKSGDSGSLPNLAFKVLCFNRQDGKLIWEQTAITATPHQETHSTNGFASQSPCTDGEHVYAHFGSRGLYCYTMDGKLVWKRDDFGKMETRHNFGEGSSPTLHGDKVLLPWDHEGPSALYALNKLTGTTIWKADRDEPSCWATPLVVEHAGKKQVVMNGQTCARAYDLESGKEIWRCAGQTERPCASAVADNQFVYVGSGHKGAFLGAFRLDSQGDIKGTKSVAWVIDHDTPDIASPLLSSGRLYFHKGKVGQLSCVDASTGKPHYIASRVPGLDTIYASPIAANGYVYLTARTGTTVVIKDADTLSVVATNELGETVDATPAPVDEELFIRGENHLFCIAAIAK